jgi:hypothetical protein
MFEVYALVKYFQAVSSLVFGDAAKGSRPQA